MMRTRAIYGCLGPELTPDERRFFAEARPWGFIVFGRNIVDRDQLRALIAALRECVEDENAAVLIDQEGGRVARLSPPHWRERPSAARFGALHEASQELAREAAYLNARLMAKDLADLGITVDCAPVLDLPLDGADAVIGDRAFGSDPAVVIDLGRVVLEGMLDGGVLPVMKHVPGHGRATVDSHKVLPRVTVSLDELSASDFVPFRSLNQCPLAMTAHVVFDAIDPQRPATTSPKVIRDVIRGEIGFEGALISDDISMGALKGPVSVRTKAALFAGCDLVLHCNGSMEEMKQVASEAMPLQDAWLKRCEAALSHLNPPEPLDAEAGEARLAQLLEGAA
ncbi:MAG TPA: beta-N-acetylhexosaminidase [Rhizomicrobium sp.]|jgi:beta-N-acetylhexosaminidase|nr:beta-N-acetylhexosaminidase [Rhizomicrobium sp.]